MPFIQKVPTQFQKLRVSRRLSQQRGNSVPKSMQITASVDTLPILNKNGLRLAHGQEGNLPLESWNKPLKGTLQLDI